MVTVALPEPAVFVAVRVKCRSVATATVGAVKLGPAMVGSERATRFGVCGGLGPGEVDRGGPGRAAGQGHRGTGGNGLGGSGIGDWKSGVDARRGDVSRPGVELTRERSAGGGVATAGQEVQGFEVVRDDRGAGDVLGEDVFKDRSVVLAVEDARWRRSSVWSLAARAATCVCWPSMTARISRVGGRKVPAAFMTHALSGLASMVPNGSHGGRKRQRPLTAPAGGPGSTPMVPQSRSVVAPVAELRSMP